MTTVALYKFKDHALENVLINQKFKHITSMNKQYETVVYRGEPCEEMNENCHELKHFIDSNMTKEESEEYYFQRFCCEQLIEPEKFTIDMKNDMLGEARVSSFKQLHEGFISICSANVHVLNTDIIFDANRRIYKKSLAKVFDTSNWRNGDILVVKKALKHGCNYGRFICINKSVYDLDRIIDQQDGHVNRDFAVVADYPICYWASKFECCGEQYNIIDSNSLVMCTLSKESIDYVMEERRKIIQKVIHDRENVTDKDRIIMFENEGILYGIICEFGMDPEIQNIKKHEKTCDFIISSTECDNSFYMQFPRYKEKPQTTEKYFLITKNKFVKNLRITSNSIYATLVSELMKSGVSPNNIGFIDCGEL